MKRKLYGWKIMASVPKWLLVYRVGIVSNVPNFSPVAIQMADIWILKKLQIALTNICQTKP